MAEHAGPSTSPTTEIAILLAAQQFRNIPTHRPRDPAHADIAGRASNDGDNSNINVGLACCCGRAECAYLLSNNQALDVLERDICTAAQLGQALLVRHETHMSEAENTRAEMTSRIQELEHDKKDLEKENRATIEENRGLLYQLEDLNNTISTSESHVKGLEATLQSTLLELRRLEGLASRTQELELQLIALEQEQLMLQQSISRTEADERSAVQRWKKAERNLFEVQDQLERIESEAREERERHAEVVERMERQRQVEKELSTVGRKGAIMTTVQNKAGSNVVSHFVKDILQDNANLQLGIVELREMLENSNNEVQSLREQMMLHQPIDTEDSGPPTLRAELAPKEPQVLSQELHIHHHYHAPKKETPRPKKKRHAINPALFTPPNGRMRPTPASTAAAILSQTSITIPSPTPNRWSTHSTQTGTSDFAPSSAPSSPRSNYRSSALFDRAYIDSAMDSSRPTSPGSSVDPMSPAFAPHHRKRDSTYSFKQPSVFNLDNVIHEGDEDGDVEDLPSLHSNHDDSTQSHEEESLPSDNPDEDFYSAHFAPSLRRSTSHESILSISGIDIHTLKSRPSQITMTQHRSPLLFNPRSRPSLANIASSYVSTAPITSTSTSTITATARPTLTRGGHDSTTYLRSSMGINSPSHGRTPSINSTSSGDSGPATLKASGGGGLGGWVWNRWGATPTSSTIGAFDPVISSPTASTSLRPGGHRAVSTPVSQPRQTTVERDIEAMKQHMAALGRSPGINQKGVVPGLWSKSAFERPKGKVVPVDVNREALREVLDGL